MVFGNGVKNIQAAAYNGASTVMKLEARAEIGKNFRWFFGGIEYVQEKKSSEIS